MKQKSLIALALFAGFALVLLQVLVDLFKMTLWGLGVVAMPKDIAETAASARNMLGWLVTMPWWAAALMNVAVLAIAVWFLWWSVRSLVAGQVVQVQMPEGYMTSEEAAKILDWHEQFRADLAAYQQACDSSIKFILRQDQTEDMTAKFELSQIKSLIGTIESKLEHIEKEFPNTLLGVFNARDSTIRQALGVFQRTEEVLEKITDKVEKIQPQSAPDAETHTAINLPHASLFPIFGSESTTPPSACP